MRKHKTLADFISHFGGERLARAVGVSPSTITYWKQGKTRPTPEHAKKLVALSHGRLSIGRIYGEKD